MDILEVTAALQALRESTSRTPAPSSRELETAPLIEEWVMTIVPPDGGPSLFGRVTGHPLIEDGRSVCTSELVALDREAGWARTRSRYYRLGREAGEDEVENGHP